jgi:hypothetical protein
MTDLMEPIIRLPENHLRQAAALLTRAFFLDPEIPRYFRKTIRINQRVYGYIQSNGY